MAKKTVNVKSRRKGRNYRPVEERKETTDRNKGDSSTGRPLNPRKVKKTGVSVKIKSNKRK